MADCEALSRVDQLRHGFDVHTTDDVEQMLDYLSTKFKCTQPSLELNAEETEYEYATETIRISDHLWNSPRLTDAIMHEFAHHLTRESGHEFSFTRNLVRTVKAWRGYSTTSSPPPTAMDAG